MRVAKLGGTPTLTQMTTDRFLVLSLLACVSLPSLQMHVSSPCMFVCSLPMCADVFYSLVRVFSPCVSVWVLSWVIAPWLGYQKEKKELFSYTFWDLSGQNEIGMSYQIKEDFENEFLKISFSFFFSRILTQLYTLAQVSHNRCDNHGLISNCFYKRKILHQSTNGWAKSHFNLRPKILIALLLVIFWGGVPKEVSSHGYPLN